MDCDEQLIIISLTFNQTVSIHSRIFNELQIKAPKVLSELISFSELYSTLDLDSTESSQPTQEQ